MVEVGWCDGDDHGDHEVAIAAWDGEALVGTIRLVLPRPGFKLPVEEAFDLDYGVER